MNGPGGQDVFDDPFAVEDYNPTLEFALIAAQEARDKLTQIKELAESETEQYGHFQNPVAASARKALAVAVDEMCAAAAMCATDMEAAAHQPTDSPGQRQSADDAVRAYDEVVRLYDEAVVIASRINTPDAIRAPPAPAPLPPTQSWAQVCQQTSASALGWLSQVRSQQGKLLILKPSPSTGKTRAMIEGAYAEQGARRRTIIAPRTKGLIEEIEQRVRNGKPYVRLQVITGRDDDNCPNYSNVKAVQEHGYAPGQAVCVDCDHFPRNAYATGLNVCEYYASRIRASLESRGARRGLHDYPIIITTHAGLISAFDSGGGQYGAFWACDTIFIDEDPTEALEPTISLSVAQTGYRSSRTADLPASLFARVCEEAFRIAEEERKASAHWGYKLKDPDGRITNRMNPVHSANGSAYAGRDLHSLMERALGAIANTTTTTQMHQLLRDVADHHYMPPAGKLCGFETAALLNQIVPPIGLAKSAEALWQELTHADDLRAYLYREVHGDYVDGTPDEISTKLRSRTALDDMSYAVRLEHGPDWRFVVEQSTDLRNHNANIIIGDAYAHEEHYRQLFHKPASHPTDPSYTNPVTLLDLVAHFPPETRIIRMRTKSTIGYLEKGNFQINEALLESVLSSMRDKRVLIYGHQSWMKPRVEKMMEWAADKYGIAEWAYEHWWGGRGKDEYKDFDACVVVSEPVFNIGAMLHKANARAFRDARRSGTDSDKLDHSERIRFEPSTHGLSDAFRKAHPRLRQEHERLNENELAQAIHRVRPLINPRKIFVMSDSLDFSRDLLAGTVTPDEALLPGLAKGLLRNQDFDVSMSATEVDRAIESILEWHGVCGSIFTHALIQSDLLDFLHEARWLNLARGARLIINKDMTPLPLPMCANKALPNGADGETIPQRVWYPPVQWQRLNERIRAQRGLLYRSMAAARNRSRFTGHYRPTWHRGGGKGFSWFSNIDEDFLTAQALFVEIVENQYGPVSDGKLWAPKAKPMPSSWKDVPF